ncbi:hypothetical protein [Streptomyces sp. AD55]|uniref:hypothetical protein n=1 Tax=Streptomyces sp. AD55 TaxID=3242895 RepID=UPI0035295D09
MNRPTTLTAAAQRYTGRRVRGRPVDQSWQRRAWAYYRSTPEVRFSATWTGHAMKGATLYAGYRADDGTIVRAPDDHLASQLVASIAGGPDGQSQLLGAAGPHLTVAGEFWLLISPPSKPGGAEEWTVLSVSEVRAEQNRLLAEIDGVEVEIPVSDSDDSTGPLPIRVWEPYPERKIEADSPVRSALDLLEELHLLNAAVAAIARSRLTGRGIVVVPQGTRFPSSPTQGDAEDDLIETLITVAETAIKDPESAAAAVPIVLEVPPEMIGQIKRLTFESDFDKLAIELRAEAIRRYAIGLEIPAEILLGLGDVNHWGQWALTAEAIRLGIEPKLTTIAHALTTQWLRPLLESEDTPDADRYLVWFDTSPLRVRSNRSETALKLYELGAISGEALRRETGFDESDAPTVEELATRERWRGNHGTPPATPSRTPLPVDETEAPPDTLVAAAANPGRAALIAAADGLIWGALSAAGRKLERTPACPRSQRNLAREVPSALLHTHVTVQPTQVDQWKLLDGAWERVPEIADRYGLPADCLTAALDTYCRELIAAGVVHTYDLVPAALSTCTAYTAAA